MSKRPPHPRPSRQPPRGPIPRAASAPSGAPARPTLPATPPKPTHWGEVADWYDQLVGDDGSEYHQQVIIPGVLRLLGIKERAEKSQRVIDLACGQGVLCRKLAGTGCDVIGIDAAEPLIAAARRRNLSERLRIDYRVGDVTRLITETGTLAASLEPGTIDAITLVLAIQNMTPLSPVWHACHALLKPGGSLVIVMMHPCFRVPRQSDWVWQNNDGNPVQARAVQTYLSSEKIDIHTHPGLAAHGKSTATTPHFHRPLQAYINTLGNAGLWIDHIDEWISHKISQPGPKKAALDRARKEIPMFLALRARKP